jgi:hypothetical protein
MEDPLHLRSADGTSNHGAATSPPRRAPSPDNGAGCHCGITLRGCRGVGLARHDERSLATHRPALGQEGCGKICAKRDALARTQCGPLPMHWSLGSARSLGIQPHGRTSPTFKASPPQQVQVRGPRGRLGVGRTLRLGPQARASYPGSHLASSSAPAAHHLRLPPSHQWSACRRSTPQCAQSGGPSCGC